MALGLDGSALLRAIADHPDAFPAIKPDIVEFARKALVKQIKDKATTLDLFRRIAAASGEGTLTIVLDGFSGSEIAGLAKKVDPHGAHAKAKGDEAAARAHLLEIAKGRAQPAEKAAKPEKAPKLEKAPSPKADKSPARTPASKIGTVLESKVHSGVKPKASPPKNARAKKMPTP